jgi:predicted nucleic acid-binding protein
VTYLLDTNVVSEIRKRRPDPHVLAWWDRVKSADIFLSALTIGEIRLGVERLRRKDRAQAERLARWLDDLQTAYADHIVAVDAHIVEEWGRMNVPDPLPVIDGLLAATARVRGWILVTRNVDDVAGRDVAVINPFEPAGR